MNKNSEKIARIEKFLEEIGVKVVYSDEISDSYCDLYWYEVHVPRSSSEESKLFSLLHEGGHFIIEADERYLPPAADSIDVVINEVLAWDAGLEIAEVCFIPIDREMYYDTAKSSITKYMNLYKESGKKDE